METLQDLRTGRDNSATTSNRLTAESMSFDAIVAALVNAVRETLRDEIGRDPTPDEVLVVIRAMGLPANATHSR